LRIFTYEENGDSGTAEAMAMSDMVPRKTLVKYGSQGLGGLVGGAVILTLGSLGAVASIVVGSVVGIVGLVLSRSKDDRTAGLVALAAGAVTALTAVPFLGGIAGSLLGIGGLGLLVVGGINLFKFIRGYRSRA
jgi:hypothetical protein